MALQPVTVPEVTSVKPAPLVEYSLGFKNPSGGFPDAMRASLTRVRTPAEIGEATLVPSTKFGATMLLMINLTL